MKNLTITILMLFLAAAVFAQKGDYSQYAGYVDLGDFDSIDKGDEVTEVLIEEHLIKMVAKMTRTSEPELSDLLDGIKLVKVHAFDTNEKSFEKIQERAAVIDEELMEKNWDRIVKVRSSKEFANVYIKTDGELIIGLVVTTGEKRGESAFVNIVGDINLETIGQLGTKFNIPSLDHINGGTHN